MSMLQQAILSGNALRQHCAAKHHPCPLCNKLFLSTTALRDHCSAKHNGPHLPKAAKSTKKPAVTSINDRNRKKQTGKIDSFPFKSFSLFRGRRLENQERKKAQKGCNRDFSCPSCRKRFFRQSDLLQHARDKHKITLGSTQLSRKVEKEHTTAQKMNSLWIPRINFVLLFPTYDSSSKKSKNCSYSRRLVRSRMRLEDWKTGHTQEIQLLQSSCGSKKGKRKQLRQDHSWDDYAMKPPLILTKHAKQRRAERGQCTHPRFVAGTNKTLVATFAPAKSQSGVQARMRRLKYINYRISRLVHRKSRSDYNRAKRLPQRVSRSKAKMQSIRDKKRRTQQWICMAQKSGYFRRVVANDPGLRSKTNQVKRKEAKNKTPFARTTKGGRSVGGTAPRRPASIANNAVIGKFPTNTKVKAKKRKKKGGSSKASAKLDPPNVITSRLGELNKPATVRRKGCSSESCFKLELITPKK